MSRSDSVYLQDIVQSIDIVFAYLQNKTEFDFVNETLLQDAVIRRFEIIGEASSKISDALKLAHPDVEWRLMKAMRNKLIHEYFGVSANTIYHTATLNLPTLKEQFLKIAFSRDL
ncbi:DUF86 domain-containing protein [uncultured Mucilaginibacter sp.]|uniref:HepT-like ribonuclease domain-containing protein n=1 Tax=uncultured Mucilaginibacter sp. TaxID=797541 RepID=UPI0025FFF81B|nr:DUF86 domain-containing protein [uncultured Mucilaginibacter sp.]